MKTAETIYAELIQDLQTIEERIIARSPFGIESVVHRVEVLVDNTGLIQELLSLTMKKTPPEADYLSSHQVNDMIYCLKIAMGLQYSRTELIEAGVAGLLHDVGMYLLPKEILFKPGELDSSEINILRSHAELGREILSPFAAQYPFLPEVAYQHHERENGSGYPGGLRGTQIHKYAQIICLLDCYEAMTHNRPNRKALNQTFSAKELVIDFKQGEFHPRVIKAFLEEITVYPPGSFVQLNNNFVCEVVATSRSNPLRPDVKICLDHLGNRVEEEQIIKLRESPVLFITDCLSPDSLPRHLRS